MSLLFRLFGARIARELAENKFRPKGFDGMDFAYTDLSGHQYYTWPDIAQMPPMRVSRIEDLMVIASGGTSRERMEEFAAKGEELNTKALRAKNDNERAKFLVMNQALWNELAKRATEVIPEETYYQLAAVCVCRDDENPSTVDASIQSQKVEELRKAASAGSAFFLTTPVFSKLLGASLTTESAWTQLQANWILQRLRMKGLFQALSSETTSAGSTKAASASP